MPIVPVGGVRIWERRDTMKKILCFVADLFDEMELFYPALRMREEGFEIVFAGPERKIYHGKDGMEQAADIAFSEVQVSDYEALLIPGGYAPDKIRVHEGALAAVRVFDQEEKPIGMICHAAWVGASAGIIKDRKLTSTSAIKDDLIHAGAHWINEAPVVDGNLITARDPADLPDYMRSFIDKLKEDKNISLHF